METFIFRQLTGLISRTRSLQTFYIVVSPTFNHISSSPSLFHSPSAQDHNSFLLLCLRWRVGASGGGGESVLLSQSFHFNPRLLNRQIFTTIRAPKLLHEELFLSCCEKNMVNQKVLLTGPHYNGGEVIISGPFITPQHLFIGFPALLCLILLPGQVNKYYLIMEYPIRYFIRPHERNLFFIIRV